MHIERMMDRNLGDVMPPGRWSSERQLLRDVRESRLHVRPMPGPRPVAFGQYPRQNSFLLGTHRLLLRSSVVLKLFISDRKEPIPGKSCGWRWLGCRWLGGR